MMNDGRKPGSGKTAERNSPSRDSCLLEAPGGSASYLLNIIVLFLYIRISLLM